MSWVASLLKGVGDRKLDAIVIAVGGALTFIALSIYAIVAKGQVWAPRAYGIGFGAMASGLGILFRFRGHNENDSEE